MKVISLLFLFCISLCAVCFSQQRADNIVIPKIENPKFTLNKGPKIYIDHKHNNFHTITGRFKPFSDLLKKDGYQLDSILDYQKLNTTDVLVISNPIHPGNIRNWRQPIYNAFSDNDILAIENWVKKGGKLLLIADHMPFAGAANSLANQFGFDFCDGFAQLTKERPNSPDFFSTNNDRLLKSSLNKEIVDKNMNSITTFTGSSFTIPEKAIGILKFKKEDFCLAPEIAWRFTETTKRTNLDNKYQGAILNYGKGKVAVFGEAAMFTAQTVTNNNGTFKFGFHATSAPNNIKFIRNLMFWLSKNKT